MSRLDPLREVVAEAIVERATTISRHLTELGVPHALIGGLAVGVHGHVRATKDVDFLVGEEAFATTSPLISYREELKDLVRWGYTDLISVPPKHPELAGELALGQDIPVISLPGLVLMKLEANRPRDREDVRALMALHQTEIRRVRDYLAGYAPELVHRFAETLVEAR